MTRTEDRQDVDGQFEQILRDRDIRRVFQPVVQLPSRAVVGFEALVRGPEGSGLASANSLVAAANRVGRLVEFDWLARASACRAALNADLDIDYTLFLNIEPIALDSECPPDLWPDIERAFHTFRVVLEVIERSLDRDPGTLLDGVERQRPLVAGIGLDDAHPATLSMLPLVAPNVIKIDRSVVRTSPDEDVARVLNAVHGEADRTGAIILAEGVETVEQWHHTLAHGAQLGQGTLFGAPGPLPDRTERPRHTAPLRRCVARRRWSSPRPSMPCPGRSTARPPMISWSR